MSADEMNTHKKKNVDITKRKRMETALLEKEHLLSESQRIAHIGSWFYDMRGRILWSDEMYRIYGVSPETFTLNAASFINLIHPDDQSAMQTWIDACMAGEKPGELEFRTIHPDGTIRFVSGRGELKYDAENKPAYMAGTAQDITERKSVEKALQRNEQLLQLFVEHSPAPIAMFDRDMKYIMASRRFLIDYNLGDQNLIGRSHYELFPEIPERWREIHRRCLAGAIEKSEEDPFLRADGKIDWVRWEMRPWYETQGEVGGIILFSEVITERMRAEEEIRTVNEELLAINRIIMACSTILDTKEILNKIMDESIQITGLEGGTICLVGPDETLELAVHRATSEATIQDLTTNAIKVGDCLCGACARDLKPLILRDRESVLRFATREAIRGEDIRFHAAFPLIMAGKCLGVLCVFTRTDKKPVERSLKLLETITTQITLALDNARLYEETAQYAANLEDRVKARTAELATANEKLKELDRLKSMFIASMSHELRTPLNSVIGFSSVLLNEWKGPLNDEQKKLLSTISRSGKHLLALINDVIDVSKIEAGEIDVHLEKFDLYVVIAEVVELLEKDIREKHLELKVDSIHLPMHTDKRRLFQSVLNLVSNAVKFTLKGSLHIAVQRIQNPEVRILNEKGKVSELKTQDSKLNTDFVEISVTDTGIGIRKEDIPKLFMSFIRLDSPLRTTVLGTGLGLYLTKKLVSEILRGEIFVESIYEEGSKFTIRMPVKISEYQSSKI
ncbi:MAG: PAS domain S-box protein [Candidatus Schekmanbacteria bacterium]|nr:PAS domain S-box protein [Candidatus Schekmanbacteria bacterium]